MSPIFRLICVSVLLGVLHNTKAVLYSPYGSSTLHGNDDGYSGSQSLSTSFPFFGSSYNTLYVCTNGIISFGGGISSYTPTPFPISSRPVVAPFWGDVDTRRAGSITYGQYTSGTLLSSLTSSINAVYGGVVPNYRTTWAYVVTWNGVKAYPGSGSQTNTFQAALATDGNFAFVVYNYQSVTWTFGSASRGISAQVGFDAGNRQNFYAHDWSRTSNIANMDGHSNVGVNGRWIFRVDLTVIVPVEEIPQCNTGYTGDDCADCAAGYVRSGSSCVVNHCLSHNCANGATCNNGGSGYTCTCAAAWLGSTCSTRDYCYGQSCSSRGSCSNGGSGYTCNCNTGYIGTNCESCGSAYVREGGNCVWNYCRGQSCNNVGSCNNGGSGYTCTCNTGYVGTHCENCHSNYIRENGVCVWNYCLGQSCSNVGSCNNGGSGYTCSCNTGYTGTNCESCATEYTRENGICVWNYCYQQTCSDHGGCINGGSDYTCNCNRGYIGTNCENCQVAYVRSGSDCVTDYCYGQTCNNHGTCNNGASAYTCSCSTGYAGTNCFSCASTHTLSAGVCVVDHCIGETCSNHGDCVNGDSGYSCTCDTGYDASDCQSCSSTYVLSGGVCVLNYCLGQTCSSHGTCYNGGSAYTCSCATGYAGTNCETCATGYTRDNGLCVVDYCYSVNCNQGSCVNGASSYTCNCALGYIGNNCETRDYCYLQTCNDHGTCNNGASGYTCSCNSPNYGSNCENTDVCTLDSVFCQNGGACTVETGACTCAERFLGTRCEECHAEWMGTSCATRNYCTGNDCRNGATCVNGASGYTCTCAEGYLGDFCQTYNLCTYNSITCENGGACGSTTGRCTCSEYFTGTYCGDCAPEWTGEGCALENFCNTNLCQNGASCVNGFAGYTCDCLRESNNAYEGDFCEIRDSCYELSPACHQGGCYNLGAEGATDCTCTGHWCDGTDGQCNNCCDGWTGSDCNTVDYCYQNECLNGATCVNGGSEYTCTCTDQYTGDRCEIRDYCRTELDEGNGEFTACQSNGTCVNIEGGWRCECYDSHFAGTYCEECSGGWTGDCYVVDHCSNDQCQNGGTCNNWPALDIYSCSCHGDYTGRYCETRHYCGTERTLPAEACLNDADCVNDAEGWYCECADEHFTNTYCEDCSADYTGDDCSVVNYCNGNDCENGATCHNDPEAEAYSCECTDEYTGEFCEQYDYCEVNNMQCATSNGEAQCINGDGGGACQCTGPWGGDTCTECVAGWQGDNCDQINYCDGRNCGNGDCENNYDDNTYECMCAEDYSGDHCEIFDYCSGDDDLCAGSSSQCENNDDDSGYVCNFCYNNPCDNGATCTSGADGYTCECRVTESVTFSGTDCEEAEYCDHDRCMNGATCVNDQDERLNFRCECTVDWDGKLCEFVNQCINHTCTGDQTCSTTTNETFSCTDVISQSNAQSGNDDSAKNKDNAGGMSPQMWAIIGGSVAAAVGIVGATIYGVRRKNKKTEEEKEKERKDAFDKQERPDDATVEERRLESASTARDIHVEEANETNMWEP